MIALLNFIVMISSSILSSFLYIKSVQPAALEKKLGEKAYKRCAIYRFIAGILMFIIIGTQCIYFFFPLPFNIPRFFPWAYWISVLVAIVIIIPSLMLMIKGVRDAGKETMRPSKEQTLYGGIYEKIRHPQALGEVWLWWIIPFLLNSPFLAFYSLIAIPIFYYFCVFEEKDLELRYGQDYIDYKKRTGMFIPKRKQ
ncbi:MAG: methyltransferase family protein [Candidatus Hodarchaeota archaeon]